MARMRIERAVRDAVSVALLVLGVVVGLLGMHALNTHGSANPHTVVTHAAAATVSSAPHHASETRAETTAKTAMPSEAGHGAGAVCVLALLGGLLLLLRRPSHALSDASGCMPPVRAFRSAPLPRPPSLHVLCISRT